MNPLHQDLLLPQKNGPMIICKHQNLSKHPSNMIIGIPGHTTTATYLLRKFCSPFKQEIVLWNSSKKQNQLLSNFHLI